MLLEEGAGEGNVFWLAFIFVVSVILVWLFVVCLAALVWVSYFFKTSTGGAAILLVLFCLVLGSLLQQGCAVVLNFIVGTSDPDPFVYLCIVGIAVYGAFCVFKGSFNLLDETETS